MRLFKRRPSLAEPARPLAALALAAAGALAGCASGGGPRVDPALATPVMPAAWQAPLPAASAASAASAADTADTANARSGDSTAAQGWARFNDPLLPDLIAAAQQASPTLASALARIERARASRTSAGAALLPSLGAVGSASKTVQLPQTQAISSSTLGVQAAWELDLFGAVAAGRDAAQARLDAAQAGWHNARASVAAETASSYVALRTCEALRVQTQLDADSRAETARLTELSAKAGFTPPADAALARAGAAQARNQAASQRAACDTQIKSLVELTAIAEPELRQRLAPRRAQLPHPDALALDDTLPAALLARRPDLAEAGRSLLAAAADLSQTQARQKPQISFSGSLAALASTTSGVQSDGRVWSYGPLQISLPIFDGGARAAASAAARASYDEAVAQYQALARRAVREVEASLVALQSSAEREADARLAAQDYQVSLRATESRQKGGLASLFELETARRNAVAAQSALIDLQRERAAAWISLYRALGGGFSPADASSAAAANTTFSATPNATPNAGG